ncbi:MAG: hypothetical protein FD149_1770 [Rhodospirillaceae bacterium]|nr:MAG: hypothetical protein FD149_1770 [Rhodospirillaceae bacterium]
MQRRAAKEEVNGGRWIMNTKPVARNATGHNVDENRRVTPERMLLDTVDRVRRMREGRAAIHIHLSDLHPQNKSEAHLRIALRLLESLVSGYRCQTFVLTNDDIVILGKDIPEEDAAVVLSRLRAMFSNDPLTQDDPGDGQDPFATWYDLEHDFDRFSDLTHALFTAGEERMFARAHGPPPNPNP